jgi:glycosyltransferase involved in cell wall biosynthesis
MIENALIQKDTKLQVVPSGKSKSVLLATRPLVPPWDEASKNFAYFLGREVTGHTLSLLTTQTPLVGLQETTKQVAIFPSAHFNLLSKWALFRYLRNVRDSFDITHYIFTPTTTNTRLIKHLAFPTKGKTLQTVATLRQDLYSPEELRSLLFADHIVVYTDKTKASLNALGLDNVTRIYPGIDLAKYHQAPKNIDFIRGLGFDESHFLVMYPGEYTRLGATDMLVASLITFFQAHPETDIRFVFANRIKNAADQKKKEEVQIAFAKAGVSQFVGYSDTVPDMPSLYNSADVIAFPVTNLNGKFDVPLIIIEAYACGTPVILSDLSQFSEFSNPDICVSIEAGDGSKFTESMAYLRDNPIIRENIGQNARRYVEEHFDLKDTARQYEAIYSQL